MNFPVPLSLKLLEMCCLPLVVKIAIYVGMPGKLVVAGSLIYILSLPYRLNRSWRKHAERQHSNISAPFRDSKRQILSALAMIALAMLLISVARTLMNPEFWGG